MIRLRRAVVTSLGEARRGAHDLEVAIEGTHQLARAIAYPDLVGPITTGDEVLLNTTAVDLELGTGGAHFVVAVLQGSAPALEEEPLPGRVMKARYTPWQTAVASVEETHRDVIENSEGLDGIPVVCAPLHSMIAPIAAGAKVTGDAKVVYLMTDGAALAGPFSRLVTTLREAGLLDGWITSGQAFGGELEAVTVWTGLLAAKEVLGADLIAVADGPGNLGTDTTWGVSALGSGNALNAVGTLGGRPIPALRVSFADARERHRGLSHHALTILRDICKVECNIAVPALDDDLQRSGLWDALREAKLEERHQLVEVDGHGALDELARRGVAVTSMGRGIEDDPAFFLAAGAAGVLAGRMAAERRRWR